MRFVTYKNERDCAARQWARAVEGQSVGGAHPSGEWVLCPDEPADRRFHRVFGPAQHPDPAHPTGPLLKSSLESECRKS